MNWKPVFKNCSLPYNPGDRFLVRRNGCICSTEEVNTINCLKTKPCVQDFMTLNELNFSEININTRRIYKSFTHSKDSITSKYKYWKLINPDLGDRVDIFVCKCKNTCILKSLKDDSKNDYSKLNCCHCRQLIDRCSENCINARRGE